MEQLWQMHPTFDDCLIQDIFTMESETLNNALQKSFAGNHPSYAEDLLSAQMVESFFAAPVPTPTAFGGLENDAPFSRTHQSVAPSGRVTKRKSRGTKRATTTTFITADPSNFRKMVQQVTGGSFVLMDEYFPVSPVLKPEPCRPMNGLQPCGGLHTIDSPVFPLQDSSAQLLPPPAAVADGGATQFDSFGGFPTLGSWKVM